MNVLDWIRRVVPADLKRFLREEYAQRKIARVIDKTRDALPDLNPVLMDAIIDAWGNPGYSAKHEYINALVREAWQCGGPILECGSGLSSFLLGLVGERFNGKVVTLEHNSYWAERIRETLGRNRISCVDVRVAPLKDFGGYAWYDTDRSTLPRDFALVVCDGPPKGTPGGRFGMLPQMREFLRSGCVILLDDVDRAEEMRILEDWSRALGAAFIVVEAKNPYGRLIVP